MDKSDKHEPKIIEQKSTLKALSIQWFTGGEIDENARDEIIAMVDAATFSDFMPLLYVIPKATIGARAKLVPVANRASLDPEYVIADLDRSEFEPIEMVAP